MSASGLGSYREMLKSALRAHNSAAFIIMYRLDLRGYRAVLISGRKRVYFYISPHQFGAKLVKVWFLILRAKYSAICARRVFKAECRRVYILNDSWGAFRILLNDIIPVVKLKYEIKLCILYDTHGFVIGDWLRDNSGAIPKSDYVWLWRSSRL